MGREPVDRELDVAFLMILSGSPARRQSYQIFLQSIAKQLVSPAQIYQVTAGVV